MIYPLPLEIRSPAVAQPVVEDAVRTDFGIVLQGSKACWVSGRIVSRDGGVFNIVQLTEDTDAMRAILAAKHQETFANANVIKKKVTRSGDQFVKLNLEDNVYLLSCVQVSMSNEDQDEGERLRLFSRLHAAILAAQSNGAERTAPRSDFVVLEITDLIATHAQSPKWVRCVLDRLLVDVRCVAARLKCVENHGDCHLGNFVIGQNQNFGLLPSPFQGQLPIGYDLATAIWSLLQSHDTETAIRFLKSVSSEGKVPPELAGSLVHLIVLRCIWWIGLRCTWRKAVPFETISLIERHLEFALNLRVLDFQFRNALDTTSRECA